MLNHRKFIWLLVLPLLGLYYQPINSATIASQPVSKEAIAVSSDNPFSFHALLTKLKARNPTLSLQLGGYFPVQGKAQAINIEGLIGDYFSVDHHSTSNALVGIGYYLNGNEFNKFDLAYGINAFYLPHTSVSGTITQEQLFTNLAYNYLVTYWPIFIAAKAIVKNNYSEKFNVTFDVGIGPDIIQTSNFSESPLDPSSIPDQAFSGKTSTAFSAMVGAGIKINNVLGNVPLECGYRFMYLGQGNFNKLTNQIVNTLNTGNSYANTVLCSISF